MGETGVTPEKTYFVAENIFKYDPAAVERVSKGNKLVVPLFELRKIDARASHSDEERQIARQVSMHLDLYEKDGLFSSGVETRSGGIILVTREHALQKKKEKKPLHNLSGNGIHTAHLGTDTDTRIVYEALRWKNEHPEERVILLSMNLFQRLTAQAHGLEAEDYRHDRIASLDPGVVHIKLTEEDRDDVFNLICRGPKYSVDAEIVFRAAQDKSPELIPNQFCRITRYSVKKGQEEEIYCIFKIGEKPYFRLVEEFKAVKNRKIIPKNLEQRFLYQALMDESITMVAAGGPGGTGKTLLAMQAGYELLQQDLFDQVLVFRPNNEVGDPLGFLPGSLEEKVEPWKTPIIQALGKILPRMGGMHSNDTVCINGVRVSMAVRNLLNEGFVQISAINHIQGVTFGKCFVIIDEAQNIRSEDMHMLLTRIGEGSRCVVIGDMGQVHNPKIKQLVSGLVDSVECMTGVEEFCYVTLWKSERSDFVRKIIERFRR